MIISKGTRNRQINRRQMLKAAVAIAGGMVVLSDPKRGGAQPASGPPPEQQLQGQDLEDALLSPVESDHVDALEPKLEAGIALCLSGGGYRAMLFHVGVLWRLNELGYLPKLDRISSVSGGSITSGVLGLSWSYLDFDVKGVAQGFVEKVVKPIRALASRTIDLKAVTWGVLTPGSVSEKVRNAYSKYLFGDSTIQDLPDVPRFILNATNVQSGALWRFSKPYMADYRVGQVLSPKVPIAVAVAASSAFPPILSPLEMQLEPGECVGLPGSDLHREPYTTTVVLTDGGVYDNIGIETAWKRYTTILVSDAGQKTKEEEEPDHNWAGHSLRVLDLIDNQVRSLRKRQIMESFKRGIRKGAYWGIRTDIRDYGLSDVLPCPFERTLELANIPTRLQRLDSSIQERLVNWGYAVCDAGLRKHVEPGLPAPSQFPYSEAKV